MYFGFDFDFDVCFELSFEEDVVPAYVCVSLVEDFGSETVSRFGCSMLIAQG
jgi:hypothetical protein